MIQLRNKKTGEIVNSDDYMLSIGRNGIALRTLDDSRKDYTYKSLAEFVEEWEDYKPKEPFIEDEKKLDAVKSFFTLLGITKEIYYQSVNNCFYHTDDDGITYGIDFDDDNGIDDICTGIAFTLTELCGEEE